MKDPDEVSIVATSGRSPSLDDLTALDGRWTESARAQLMAAASAADAWLADHPEDAARFRDDPAGFLAELSDSGVLTEGIDELLTIVQPRTKGDR